MLLWFCVSCTMGLFKTKNLSMLGALFVSGDASMLRGQDQSVVASKLLHGKTHQIPIKLPITSQPKSSDIFMLLLDTLSVIENGIRPEFFSSTSYLPLNTNLTQGFNDIFVNLINHIYRYRWNIHCW